MPSDARPRTPASFKEALKFWIKLGFINFGGPAGQIAIMHQEVVEKRGWITEGQFLRALNFCMLLPGPEAQQLATYIGWRLHGIPGGIAAGALFVIPSMFIILLLSYLAVAHIHIPVVAAAFHGIQAVVVAVVLEALLRIGKKALYHPYLYGFAAGAFIGIFFFQIPFPMVLAAAAAGGLLLQNRLPHVFCKDNFDHQSGECRVSVVSDETADHNRSWRHLLLVILTCFILWAAVVGVLLIWRGYEDVLTQIALFFTKAAFVTFGGAYAVLSYISGYAVPQGWLTTDQMLIGLGLAESTPGPLIMVTQYIGFLGAWNLHGSAPQFLNATLGALIATYVTFLPSFLFIFVGAPFIEALAGNQRLQAALTGVTAAVVGVILNLAVWFGLNILFPEPGHVDGFALVTILVSFVLLRRFHLPIHALVPLGAIAGILWSIAR
ncbi:chromate transporter [Desulfonatronum thiosulfatophilum]|uniref:Chromate transporter n=1 Tax=Desulfonatronum thiosulfatophilum TaxID=617002 RepID=A0A1G6DB65_9BACT|nr:chromate efflux transporter [Desulfonatronum thiosulfatophilum]SDB42423.1 chromate transporter [Desulfonatronum thiosulfatophilum]